MGVTVKDVPAIEFIEAFSKHLKKGNKIKMPEVSPVAPCDLRGVL
jgi:ribosomal protein S19E (S16A)